jgi:coniferyl-aldehyde dehydrogenase
MTATRRKVALSIVNENNTQQEINIQQELENTLKLQREAYLAHPNPSFSERKIDLKNLQEFLRDYRDELCEAVNADYGHRSKHETLFTEIFPAIDGVDQTLKHLKNWMKPQQRAVDIRNFIGASNKVIPQPLGVVGSIVPWNFPINLSFMGLISIFAAGNRAMVKMSENSRHLTRLIIEKIPEYFPKEKLAFFEETGSVGIEFSKLPFDHLMFTGSGQTGRAVMASAARNLCPVTLELGGKSPAIVCRDYSISKAAERIMFVKLLNAGQICTSVDHIYLPKGKSNEFVTAAKSIAMQRYGKLASTDYTSIIDDKSFKRLTDALDEAKEAGAKIIQLLPGKKWDEKTRKIAPHIVLNAPKECALMQREIFGPILPVIEYASLEDPIKTINNGARPLAIYPFSNDKEIIEMLINRVMSGGVSVNDALFHVAQHDLPFGGVGESGMGHYHGYEGFVTFSKMRPVFQQAPISAIKLMYPPYGTLATTYLDILTK